MHTFKGYDTFLEHYQNACSKWNFDPSETKLLKNGYLPISLLNAKEIPDSALAVNFDKKSLAMFLNPGSNTEELLFEDEYESIKELEQESFMLDAKALKAKHKEDLDALFGDYLED